MGTATVAPKQYLDDEGNPIAAPNLPKGSSSVKDLKLEAAKRKPVTPPPGYLLSPNIVTPFQQLRNVVANSAIGHSLEQTMPKVATALNLHPSETVNSPTYEQHKDQLLSPEYVTSAISDQLGLSQPNEERLEGALKGVGGLTSGKNLALMGGTAVAAGLTAGVVNPASAQVLSHLVSGGFTLDMLHGLYQQHKEYRKAVDSGNEAEAHKIQGEIGVTGIMALLTGKHALTNHPFTPVAEAPRERTNVLHRNTAGEVRQAKGQAPTVWLSPSAWESFMGSLYPGEDATATHGVNLPANEHLKSFANDPKLAAANPQFAEVQKLLDEAHKNAGEGGVAVANQRPSIQKNVNVMREELNHTWQRSLSATGNFSNHLKPEAFDSLHQSIPDGMHEYLLDQGYDGESHPEMVTEAAAKLMDGRPERFGTTPDEAVDFLDKYFKHVSDQHGTGALEELHHVRGIAADAKARAIGEHSGTGGGQDNSAVSGVAAGGQGEPAQGLPAQGGEVNGATTQAVQNPIPSSESASGAGVSPETAEQHDPLQASGAFNRDKDKPTWYLKSERLIGDKMKGPQAAEDVHKMLISGGVKPEEMQWTGLDDFLKSKGKDKVTPQEIKDHLAANNLQIREVTKGEPTSKIPLTAAENSEADALREEHSHRNLEGAELARLRELEARHDAAAGFRMPTDTKYGKYVLPGGENYREMLLTLPPTLKSIEHWRINRPDGYAHSVYDNEGAARKEAERLGEGYTVERRPDVKMEGGFKSGHWEEPNILAHVRFNDRVGPNGEKLLHVEELQSDAHQQARTKGYRSSDTTDLDAAKKEHEGRVNALAEADKTYSAAREETKKATGSGLSLALEAEEKAKQVVLDAMREERSAASEYEGIINRNKNGIPDLPFKKTWHEMALRRILKMATDKGYSGVSWTGGEDQADRYSLAKQISRVEYAPVDGTLNAYDLSGSRVMREVATPEELPDYIGKEAANKLLQTPRIDTDNMKAGDKVTVQHNGKMVDATVNPDRRLNEGKPHESVMVTSTDGKENRWFVPLADLETHTLANADLKVGGEGMKGFYDKIVPDYLNKFGKKFNAKVGETEFPVPGDKRITIRRGINGWDVESRLDENVGREQGLAFFSDEDFGGRDGAQKSAQKDAEDRSAPKKKVQYLPITPEMRQSVGQEGVPLFNREQQGENKDSDVPVASGYRSIVDTGSLGIVDLTPEDYALINNTLGGGDNSNARNLSLKGAQDLAVDLMEHANSLPDTEMRKVNAIASHILKAAKDNGVAGVPILKIDPNRTPAEQRELEMHEAVVHGGQRAVAGDGNARSLFPEPVIDAIGKNILARKAWYALHNAGYDMSDRPLMAIESEAFTLAGKFKRHNILTDNEADELMWEHLQAQTAHHGDKLNTVDPTGQKYVQALREAAKRHDDTKANRDFPQFELPRLGEGSGQETEVPSSSGTSEGGSPEGDQSDSGAGSEGVGDEGEGESDSESLEDRNLSAEQDYPTDLDVNTNTEGDAGDNKPEQVAGSTGTAPTTIQVQGGTVIHAAPKQEPVVPVRRDWIPREDTTGGGYRAPVGTKRIGREGYVDVLTELPIADLVMPEGNRLYPQSIQKYQAEGDNDYPVVIPDERGNVVDDGNHRVEAARRAGKSSTMVWMRQPEPSTERTKDLEQWWKDNPNGVVKPQAKVLSRQEIMAQAAAMNPNPQRQVHSVRELMKMAKSRMVP